MKGFGKHNQPLRNFNPLREILNLLHLTPEPNDQNLPEVRPHVGRGSGKCRKHQCRRASRQANVNARPRR